MFVRWVRKRIFKRDNATCQVCGRRWNDGWFLQCAHYENGKTKPTNNSVNGGRMLCISCHIAEHKKLYRQAKRRNDRSEMKRHAYAVRKLKQTNHRRRGW